MFFNLFVLYLMKLSLAQNIWYSIEHHKISELEEMWKEVIVA